MLYHSEYYREDIRWHNFVVRNDLYGWWDRYSLSHVPIATVRSKRKSRLYTRTPSRLFSVFSGTRPRLSVFIQGQTLKVGKLHGYNGTRKIPKPLISWPQNWHRRWIDMKVASFHFAKATSFKNWMFSDVRCAFQIKFLQHLLEES